jgi:quercetin dioxygenase-like cupin family protein
MTQQLKAQPRVALALSVLAAGVFVWILVGQQSTVTARQSNFMGGSPSVEDSEDLRTLRLKFPAGVRSNWHSHDWGQLLMVEEGSGLTQVRGEALYEMRAGEPWWTGAGVEHWHGAAVDEDMLQLTIYEGGVNWMDPVSDEAYRMRATRP